MGIWKIPAQIIERPALSSNERRQGYGCAARSGVTCSSAFAISAKMTDARGQRNTLADKHGSTHEDRAFHYEDDAFAAMFNLAKSVSKKTEEVELAPSLQLAIEVNTTTQRRRELHKMNANARKFEAMNWALKRAAKRYWKRVLPTNGLKSRQ